MLTEILFFVVSLIVTFSLTTMTVRFLIPKLKSIKMGQKILDVGPRWHKSKEGTPTMGGLSFLFASVVVFLLSVIVMAVIGRTQNIGKLVITFVMAVLNSLIGVLDDYTKFIKKQNEGLSAKQKYLLQFVVAVAYLAVMALTDNLATAVSVPFLRRTVEFGWLYYPMALIVVTGIINCVNLTDGIDGLASSVTCVVGILYAVLGFAAIQMNAILLSAILIGSCLGFLTYNFYPARIFMGDTGSLFLGAMAVGATFLLDQPLLILIAGIIYIIEGVTVVLQVSYFKLTHGKRLFKMTPIHHTFEKDGWSEIQIVALFTGVTLVACILAAVGSGIFF